MDLAYNASPDSTRGLTPVRARGLARGGRGSNFCLAFVYIIYKHPLKNLDALWGLTSKALLYYCLVIVWYRCYNFVTSILQICNMSVEAELQAEIEQAISQVVEGKELAKIKSLSRSKPEKVAKILYLHAIGVSQTAMIRKYGFDRGTIINTLVDYADYKSAFRELGGQLSARSYVNLESLEEDLIESVREKIHTGEYEPTPRDIKEISIAKANSARQALTARGEASSITESRNVVTQEDYEETIRKAKERIKVIEGEVIDAEG